MWGVLGATLIVTATTLDDTVWLVPYTCSTKISVSIRVLHAAIFVFTLESLAILCCLTAQGVNRLVGERENNDWVFGAIGATCCWTIAGILYIKKLLRKRQWRAQESSLQQPIDADYGTIPGVEDKQEDVSPMSFSPWTVISLTFLGALDEISYFPALLVGHVFTGWDLCIGTFVAASLILLVVTAFLSQCRPLMEWLDSIPLYGIVGMFAIVLTIGVLVDLWNEE